MEIDGPKELPEVTPLSTGQYRWETLDERVESSEDVDLLERKLRNLNGDLNHTLVDLNLSGALSLADLLAFEEKDRRWGGRSAIPSSDRPGAIVSGTHRR